MKLRLLMAMLVVSGAYANMIQVSASEVSISTNVFGTGSSTVDGRIAISGPYIYEELSFPTGATPCHIGTSFCESDFNVTLTIAGVGTAGYTLTDNSYYGAGLTGNTYALFPGISPGIYNVELTVSEFLTAADGATNPSVTSTVAALITGETADGQTAAAVSMNAVPTPEPVPRVICGVVLAGLLVWRFLRGGSRTIDVVRK